jgi:NADPH:quinone reductase-like Zn-dependent oxidoreductase
MSTLLAKRTTIKGTTLRTRPLEEKIQVSQMFGKHMVPLIEKGLIKPIIDAKFNLGEAATAHEFVESNKSFGKVVLIVP